MRMDAGLEMILFILLIIYFLILFNLSGYFLYCLNVVGSMVYTKQFASELKKLWVDML